MADRCGGQSFATGRPMSPPRSAQQCRRVVDPLRDDDDPLLGPAPTAAAADVDWTGPRAGADPRTGAGGRGRQADAVVEVGATIRS
jgi:hypothetical protein